MIILNLERTRAAVWFVFDSTSLRPGGSPVRGTSNPILLGIIRGPLLQPALEEAREQWGRRVTLKSFAEVMAALGDSPLNPSQTREP
jgi:hypothetical protein